MTTVNLCGAAGVLDGYHPVCTLPAGHAEPRHYDRSAPIGYNRWTDEADPMTTEQIRPVSFEEDGDEKGAVFEVPFIGRVTVWRGVIEVDDYAAGTWDATPEGVEHAARHLLAAAEWMRKEHGDG